MLTRRSEAIGVPEAATSRQKKLDDLAPEYTNQRTRKRINRVEVDAQADRRGRFADGADGDRFIILR